MLGGYANRIAHVDLSSATVEYHPIPENWARKYIGARGLGVRYVLQAGAEVDPLSADNLLCVMNGDGRDAPYLPGGLEAMIGPDNTVDIYPAVAGG